MRTVRRGERRSGDEGKARLRDCAFQTQARVRLSRPTLSPLLFGPPLPPTRPSPLSIPPPFSLTPRQTVPNRPPASPAAPCPFDPLSAFPSASATRIIRVVRRMRIRTTRIGGFLFQTFSRFPFSSPLFNPVSRFPLLSPFPAPPPTSPLSRRPLLHLIPHFCVQCTPLHSLPVEWGSLLGAGPLPLDSDNDSDLAWARQSGVTGIGAGRAWPAPIRITPDWPGGPARPARIHHCCAGHNPPLPHTHILQQSGCGHCFYLLRAQCFACLLFWWYFVLILHSRWPVILPCGLVVAGRLWFVLRALSLTCSQPSPRLPGTAVFSSFRSPPPPVFRPRGDPDPSGPPKLPSPARPVRPVRARPARSVNWPGPARGAADPTGPTGMGPAGPDRHGPPARCGVLVGPPARPAGAGRL